MESEMTQWAMGCVWGIPNVGQVLSDQSTVTPKDQVLVCHSHRPLSSFVIIFGASFFPGTKKTSPYNPSLE